MKENETEHFGSRNTQEVSIYKIKHQITNSDSWAIFLSARNEIYICERPVHNLSSIF